MKTILFILGPTNCGKSTLINKMEKSGVFYPVLIGKILRAKYPPEYFEGQAAPAKTDNDAWSIMVDEINSAHNSCKIPMIDGQPRNSVQYQWCVRDYFNNPEYDCKFIKLWASREERVRRAKLRDTDEAKLALSMRRMDDDVLVLEDIVSKLQLNFPTSFLLVNTELDSYLDKIDNWLINSMTVPLFP
jgi:hypothetical protein